MARIISAIQIATLNKDMVMGNGETIPTGSEVIIIPQTLASAVLADGEKTLAEILEEWKETLAAYQTELIRLADRVTAMQLTGMEGEANE